jgi:hypothetical protein
MFRARTTEFYAEYEEALNWIHSLGVAMNPSSRLSSYKSCFERFVSAFLRKDQVYSEMEMKRIGAEIINAFYEANEVVVIYKVFRASDPEHLKLKIKEIVSGPVNGAAENMAASSNRARNISFELYAASIFHAAGMGIDFSSIADAQFNAGRYTYYLECKRPQNTDRVEKNIKSANIQFRKRFSQRPEIINKRGILALSFSKIVNPNYQVFQFNTFEDAEQFLKPKILRVGAQYSDYIKNKIDRKVVLWAGFTSIPVIVRESGMDFSIYKSPMLVNITHQTEFDHNFINEMELAIKSVYDSDEF